MHDFQPTKRVNSLGNANKAAAASTGSFLYQRDVKEFRPSWRSGHLVFRILPAIAPDGDGILWDPIYVTTDSGERVFGDWVYGGLIAANAGRVRKFTFFLNPTIDGEFNIGDSPYYILYSAVESTKNWPSTQRKWIDKLAGNSTAGAELPDPSKPQWFMQSLVYFRDQTAFTTSLSNPPVVRLSNSAGQSLKRIIDQELAANPDFDITALDQSHFVTVWNGQHPNPYTRVPGTPNVMRYDVCFTDTYVGNDQHTGTSGLLTEQEDQVRAGVTPWRNLLRFLSFEEQAELMFEAFSDTPDMLDYAYKSFSYHPEWFPEGFNKRLQPTVAAQTHPSVASSWAPISQPYTPPTMAGQQVCPPQPPVSGPPVGFNPNQYFVSTPKASGTPVDPPVVKTESFDGTSLEAPWEVANE